MLADKTQFFANVRAPTIVRLLPWKWRRRCRPNVGATPAFSERGSRENHSRTVATCAGPTLTDRSRDSFTLGPISSVISLSSSTSRSSSDFGDRRQLIGMLLHRSLGEVLGGVQDLFDFFVDHLRRVLAELPLVLGDLAAEERMILAASDTRPGPAARSCPSA